MALSATISGTVWRLGDHVNTDLLHPPAFFSLDRERMADGLREGMGRLGARLGAGALDGGLVILAGENFGCGSSRETSVRSLVLCRVQAVVAKSFARIFYRSLVNLGIPPVECTLVPHDVSDGDRIQIFLDEGFIKLGDGRRYPVSPFDRHIERILACGGLIPYLREERGWGTIGM